jgi:hypothetical protein
MSAPNFTCLYTRDDQGWYQLVESDYDKIVDACKVFAERPREAWLELMQINGAPLGIFVSCIQGVTRSTEDTRDTMFRLKQMFAEEKMQRGDFSNESQDF